MTIYIAQKHHKITIAETTNTDTVRNVETAEYSRSTIDIGKYAGNLETDGANNGTII